MPASDTVHPRDARESLLRNAEGKPVRIGFVHRRDSTNRLIWSGTMFSMGRSLDAHVGEVVHLGPDESKATRLVISQTPRLNRVWEKLTGKPLMADQNRLLSWQLARFFRRRLKEISCQILFVPVGSTEIAYLKTNLPIVYYSDLTWDLITDYYPQYSSLSAFAKQEGERIEARAMRSAAAVAFPSEWAAQSARQHYGTAPESTFTVSFGANFPELPEREEALRHSLGGPVRLLMVGVDWIRKGGPIAFECLTCLLQMGIDAQLTICGCIPPAGYEHPNLEVIPYLNKKVPEQRARLGQLFLDSHFFLFPTRADATPIATCEASAFGLPTLATNTGGVGGAIRDGVNGFLMPYEAGGAAYAEKIAEIVRSPDLYRRLVIGSRDEYENRLNWDAWGRGMRTVFEYVLAKHGSQIATH